MGPQPEAEGNVPKDDDTSEDELPRIPPGTFGVVQGDDATLSSDDEDVEGVDRGGYQLLNGDVEDDADDDDSENETNENEGWARFDQFESTETASHPANHDDDDRVARGRNDECTVAGAAGPPSAEDNFLAGGAHLLPGNLRSVSPPRVTSLDDSVREIWAGRRNDAVASASQNMSKVDDIRIRKVMAKITLPTTAVPEWATQLSEEEWRKALNERLNLPNE